MGEAPIPNDGRICSWRPCTFCSSVATGIPWPPTTTRCGAPGRRTQIGVGLTSSSISDDFCLGHRTELLELLAVRSTQTNEVGRCAALLPGFNAIAAALSGRSASVAARPGHVGRTQSALRSYAYTTASDRTASSCRPASPAPRCSSSAPCATSLEALPSLNLPPMAREPVSTPHRSTRPPTMGPGGCWPASGRTTSLASPGCGALC